MQRQKSLKIFVKYETEAHNQIDELELKYD